MLGWLLRLWCVVMLMVLGIYFGLVVLCLVNLCDCMVIRVFGSWCILVVI